MPSRRRLGAAAAAPLAATAVGVFAEGGYATGARIAFAAAALAAVIAVRPPRGLWREPIPAALLALAALGLASLAWTVGLPEETLTWALVTAGYACVAVASAAAARTGAGVQVLAGGIALLAAITAVLGLTSAALHDPAFAVRIAGEWRPAGPFEYSPALVLLQVSALPVLIAGMRQGGTAAARAAAGVGLALAAAVMVLASSRLGLALGIVVAGVAIAPPRLWTAIGITAVAAAAGTLAFGSGTDFLHGRAQTWRAAIETFADRPFQGAGADAFLAASARHQDGQTIAFAHNLPLEAAAELGVIGLALVLALYAASAVLLWRRRATAACRLFGPAFAAFLVFNLLDWPWHLAGSGAVWALAAGALLLQPQPDADGRGAGRP